MAHWIRAAIGAFGASLLVGCSSIPIYRLPVSPPAEPLVIADERTSEEKLLRPVTRGNKPGHRLGDVFLVPQPTDLLATALIEAAGDAVRTRKIVLRRFDVTIIEGGSVDAADVGRSAAPINAPPGAAMLAFGLISLIEHARHGTLVDSEISLSIDQSTCWGSAKATVRAGVKAELIRDLVFAATKQCWESVSDGEKALKTAAAQQTPER